MWAIHFLPTIFIYLNIYTVAVERINCTFSLLNKYIFDFCCMKTEKIKWRFILKAQFQSTLEPAGHIHISLIVPQNHSLMPVLVTFQVPMLKVVIYKANAKNFESMVFIS